MDFMNKKPTDADRFIQRVTSQHSSTSLFSNAHVDTSEMTPEQLAAFKEKKRQEQKMALMNSIKKQLSYAFQEDRKNLSSIHDDITDAEQAVKAKREMLDHHMSGKAIDSVTDQMKDQLSFDKVRSDVSSLVNSIGL
ncbi:hypothetical protein [Bacillus inaquosorum]|uniref:hypothetical protein n=1 Tax=Bacillus inaquosorum TaxID=483913 RepID=UPI000745D110|nr:hypothetical protein [Bacillus inaquosorum]PPA35909.1 hypothetical protein C4E21_13765 [Bacillus subtilis]AMA54516.1 hypothetical protein AN935_20365 [Bacillus inaquosorum]MBT2192009.1 hypothetical protein [Bacillus inaquosorum]MBT3118384.1 hypothetical protein [Bacillus inaquosorum]MBT3124054.1 hypothetical protein [Bacillus inaquosorum]